MEPGPVKSLYGLVHSAAAQFQGCLHCPQSPSRPYVKRQFFFFF